MAGLDVQRPHHRGLGDQRGRRDQVDVAAPRDHRDDLGDREPEENGRDRHRGTPKRLLTEDDRPEGAERDRGQHRRDRTLGRRGALLHLGSVPLMASPVEPRQSDWTVQVADTIEAVVGSIRDKTTVPAETAARAVVYGILVGVMGSAIAVLLTIALVRLLDNWLRIWAVYAILGGLFTLVGLFLWRKRRPRAPR